MNGEFVVVDNLSFPGESRCMFVRRFENEPAEGWSKWNQRAVFSGTKDECEEFIEQRRVDEEECKALFESESE